MWFRRPVPLEPNQRLRVQIRRRQQSQIKATIMGRYQLIEVLLDCLDCLEGVMNSSETADMSEEVLLRMEDSLDKYSMEVLEQILWGECQADSTPTLLPKLTTFLTATASTLTSPSVPLVRLVAKLSYCRPLLPLYLRPGAALLELLCTQVCCVVRPEGEFFACLVALGNVMVYTMDVACRQGQWQPEGNELTVREKAEIKQQQIGQMYQLLQDASLEDILRVRIVVQLSEDCTPSISQDEELYLWLINIYTKWLAYFSLPLYANQLFVKDLTQYISHHFALLVSSNNNSPNKNNNSGYGRLSQSQYHRLKQLQSILLHSNLQLENVVIVNCVMPVIRGNWHKPAAVELWLMLTQRSQYNMLEMVWMQGTQDRLTVKHSADQGESGGEDGHTCTHGRHQHIHGTHLQQLRALVKQILQSISDGGPYHQHKHEPELSRNKIKSILNLLIEMPHPEAQALWEHVYGGNAAVRARLEGVDWLQGEIDEIGGYLADDE